MRQKKPEAESVSVLNLSYSPAVLFINLLFMCRGEKSLLWFVSLSVFLSIIPPVLPLSPPSAPLHYCNI